MFYFSLQQIIAKVNDFSFSFSGIHDHSNAHCWMKVMDGTLTENLYNWPSDDKTEIAHDSNMMSPHRQTEYKDGQVAYINGNSVLEIKLKIPVVERFLSINPKTMLKNHSSTEEHIFSSISYTRCYFFKPNYRSSNLLLVIIKYKSSKKDKIIAEKE